MPDHIAMLIGFFLGFGAGCITFGVLWLKGQWVADAVEKWGDYVMGKDKDLGKKE